MKSINYEYNLSLFKKCLLGANSLLIQRFRRFPTMLVPHALLTLSQALLTAYCFKKTVSITLLERLKEKIVS